MVNYNVVLNLFQTTKNTGFWVDMSLCFKKLNFCLASVICHIYATMDPVGYILRNHDQTQESVCRA